MKPIYTICRSFGPHTSEKLMHRVMSGPHQGEWRHERDVDFTCMTRNRAYAEKVLGVLKQEGDEEWRQHAIVEEWWLMDAEQQRGLERLRRMMLSATYEMSYALNRAYREHAQS